MKKTLYFIFALFFGISNTFASDGYTWKADADSIIHYGISTDDQNTGIDATGLSCLYSFNHNGAPFLAYVKNISSYNWDLFVYNISTDTETQVKTYGPGGNIGCDRFGYGDGGLFWLYGTSSADTTAIKKFDIDTLTNSDWQTFSALRFMHIFVDNKHSKIFRADTVGGGVEYFRKSSIFSPSWSNIRTYDYSGAGVTFISSYPKKLDQIQWSTTNYSTYQYTCYTLSTDTFVNSACSGEDTEYTTINVDNTIYSNSYNYTSLGPPLLEITNSGSFVFQNGLMIHENLETNFTGSISYVITQKTIYDTLFDLDLKTFTLSGSIQDNYFYSDIFENGYNYEVEAKVYTGSNTGDDYFSIITGEGNVGSYILDEGLYANTLTGFTLTGFTVNDTGNIDFELIAESDINTIHTFTGSFSSGSNSFINEFNFDKDRYYITSLVTFDNNVVYIGPSLTINYLNYSFSGGNLTETGGITVIDYGGKTDVLNLPCPTDNEDSTTLEIPVFGFGTLTPFDTFSCFFSSMWHVMKPINGEFMTDNYNLENGENVLAGKYTINGETTTQINNSSFKLGDLFILAILGFIIIGYLKANRQTNG